jgi:hypothetical protein
LYFCCYYFQVSWVRQSDLAILASGGVSHTSDNRITASADETLTDWELQIAEAQTKDSVSVFGNRLSLPLHHQPSAILLSIIHRSARHRISENK